MKLLITKIEALLFFTDISNFEELLGNKRKLTNYLIMYSESSCVSDLIMPNNTKIPLSIFE